MPPVGPGPAPASDTHTADTGLRHERPGAYRHENGHRSHRRRTEVVGSARTGTGLWENAVGQARRFLWAASPLVSPAAPATCPVLRSERESAGVVLAKQVRAISHARVETNKIDAKVLADLLAADLMPNV